MSNMLAIPESVTVSDNEPKWRFTQNDFEDNPVPVDNSLPVPIVSDSCGPAEKALLGSPFNFQVALAPLEIAGGLNSPNITSYQACVRQDTNYVFGIVSPDYGFCQPIDIARLVDAALANANAEVSVGGTFYGDRLWFGAKIKDIDLGEVTRGPISANLMLLHAFGGKGTMQTKLGMDVKVCGNGLCLSLPGYEREVRLRHTASFSERVAVLQKVFMAASEATDHYWSIFRKLSKRAVTSTELIQLAEILFPGESTRTKHKREDLTRAYVMAPGAVPGTAWGLLQAATYYNTHLIDVRVGGRSAKRYSLDMGQAQSQARQEGLLFDQGAASNQLAFNYVTSLID